MVLRDIDDEELHRFEDYGELQFTASHHAPRVGRHIFDADTDVAARFEIEPLGDFARGHVIAFAPRPWRVVDAEGHYHGRLVDTDTGQWTRIFEVRDGLANFDIVEAGNHHDVAGARLGEFDPLEPLPSVEPRDLAHRTAAVVPAQRVVAAGGERAR